MQDFFGLYKYEGKRRDLGFVSFCLNAALVSLIVELSAWYRGM